MPDEDTTNEAPTTTPAPAPEPPKGQFNKALNSSNSKIKGTRALQISKRTGTAYRRRVEDLVNEIGEKIMEVQGQLDLRGDSAFSLHPASKDFNADDWVQSNIEARMEIRNLMQKLSVAYNGYEQLFGADPSILQGIDISPQALVNIVIPPLD